MAVTVINLIIHEKNQSVEKKMLFFVDKIKKSLYNKYTLRGYSVATGARSVTLDVHYKYKYVRHS